MLGRTVRTVAGCAFRLFDASLELWRFSRGETFLLMSRKHRTTIWLYSTIYMYMYSTSSQYSWLHFCLWSFCCWALGPWLKTAARLCHYVAFQQPGPWNCKCQSKRFEEHCKESPDHRLVQCSCSKDLKGSQRKQKGIVRPSSACNSGLCAVCWIRFTLAEQELCFRLNPKYWVSRSGDRRSMKEGFHRRFHHLRDMVTGVAACFLVHSRWAMLGWINGSVLGKAGLSSVEEVAESLFKEFSHANSAWLLSRVEWLLKNRILRNSGFLSTHFFSQTLPESVLSP